MNSTEIVSRPDGSTIACINSGDPKLPSILLSNSLATTWELWDKLLPSLEENFNVIRYDTRGHGKSKTTMTNSTLEDLSDDAVAVLDHFSVHKAVFAGVSLGGMTGMTTAIRHTNRLHSLIACNCRSSIDTAGIAAWEDRVAMSKPTGMQALVEPTASRWFSKEYKSDHPLEMEQVGQMITATSIEGFEACIRAIQGMQLSNQISKITLPTTFVAGSNDGAAPPEVMQTMSQTVLNSKCEILSPCGHLSPIEQPQALLDILLRMRPGHS